MPPALKSTFMQVLLHGPEPKLNARISTTSVPESKLTTDIISNFTNSGGATVIGLAPGFNKKKKLVALALCDGATALIVDFTGSRKAPAPKKRSSKNSTSKSDSDSSTSSGSIDTQPTTIKDDPRQILEDSILCNQGLLLAAFDVGPMAVGLHTDLDMKITNGIDVQSVFPSVPATPTDRKARTVVANALRTCAKDRIKQNNNALDKDFENTEYDPENLSCRKDLFSRAWLAQYLISECVDAKAKEETKKVDTKSLPAPILEMAAKTYLDGYRGSLSRQTTTQHKIAGGRNNDGTPSFQAASYKDKFRGEDKRAKFTVQGARGEYVVHGTLNANLNGDGLLKAAKEVDPNALAIKVIEASGKDDPTLADARRDAALLSVLQGNVPLLSDNPWIKNIWFPSPDGAFVWPEFAPAPRSPPQAVANAKEYDTPNLNGSQQKAVNYMLSDSDTRRLVVIQGPPGTGKTSVIAQYVIMATKLGLGGIWLVAQSNVAVKNIALKLMKVGFDDWKILVSRDFHTGWHEHLYTEDPRFDGHIILSNNFRFAKPRDFHGCKVVLATLSMLSNINLPKITQHVPITHLVIDEASQIEIGAYVPALTSFSSSLRKMCFIGDNKQLPPHGQEELGTLQSIFEVTHLKKLVVFLDTQYRMPPEIGNIISDTVYNGKLKSNPLHRITSATLSCYFIDVSEGTEARAGTSWKNAAELAAVLKLSQLLQDAEMEHKIITPYEGQTSAIEAAMKTTEGLSESWKDKCFNVDAFQGNEEDYIILSLVRSRALGFLDNIRRTNVMLTRCKKGMFILTSRRFMERIGGNSLVGEMLEILEEERGEEKVWLSVQDLEKGKISHTI